MAQSITLAGAQVKAYFGGTLVKALQTITYTVDYGEEATYGIDSAFPQEIATNKVTVQGNGVLIYAQGQKGLQGLGMRTKINEILYSPYISLRIKDRKNDLDLFFCPQVKISQESMSINAKGIVRIQFSFRGIIPYSPADLA